MTFKYAANVSLECESAQVLGLCSNDECAHDGGCAEMQNETKRVARALTWDGAPSDLSVRSFHWLMCHKTGGAIEGLWLPELKMWLLKGAKIAVPQSSVAETHSYMAMVGNAIKIEELAMSIFKCVKGPL